MALFRTEACWTFTKVRLSKGSWKSLPLGHARALIYSCRNTRERVYSCLRHTFEWTREIAYKSEDEYGGAGSHAFIKFWLQKLVIQRCPRASSLLSPVFARGPRACNSFPLSTLFATRKKRKSDSNKGIVIPALNYTPLCVLRSHQGLLAWGPVLIKIPRSSTNDQWHFCRFYVNGER